MFRIDSFEKALLKAVNLGDDADTVGAVAGGLAGLYYGYENVPEDWKAAMKKRDELEEICGKADDVNIRCLQLFGQLHSFRICPSLGSK